MKSAVDIRIMNSPREMMTFIKFPWRIYKDDPYWVPPLIMDRKKFLDRQKNPFFKSNPTRFYMAFRDGQPVGRIAAIINHRHNEVHKDKAGFFGFLEGIDDETVFTALLDTAESWLREQGCELVLGPVNPSTNDEVGFLIDGFDSSPFFMMTHNPPYYNELMTQAGYRKAKDLYAYMISEESVANTAKLDRVSAAIEKKYPVKIRSVDMKNFRDELRLVEEIYNDAWEPNWGFVPMTPEEFDFVAGDFKQIINPELALIGEFDGEAVGFLLGLPNYNEVFKKIPNGKLFPFGIFKFLLNKNKIGTMRVITLGIKRKYQPLGLGALFYREIIKRGPAVGINSAEMSWVLEDNDMMNKAAKLIGGSIHKTYRVYEKVIS